MKRVHNLAIVDDDDAFVFLTKEMVAETNMVDNISVFKNGKVALDFIEMNRGNEEELPEIILLDLSMPVMDGWQFLEKYSQLDPALAKKISIYICTSSISPDDVNRAKAQSNVSNFMVKPVTPENLISMIRQLN